MRGHRMRSGVRNIQYIGSRNQFSTSTSAVFTYPTGTVSGDLLIAVICNATGDAGYTPPSGWTEVLDSSGRTICHRIADPGSSDSTTATWSSPAGSVRCYMVCYRNAAYDARGTFPGSGTSPTAQAASVTLAKNESALLLWTSSTNAGGTFTDPSGYTSLQANEGDNDDPSMQLWHRLRVSSGATGTLDVTVSTAARSVFIGVKPITIG